MTVIVESNFSRSCKAFVATQALNMGDDKLDLAFMIHTTREVAYRVLPEVGRAKRAFNACLRCVIQ